MKLEAVLFDLDGTLVDSEDLYFESDRKFVEQLGGVYDEAFRAECVGMGTRPFCGLIKKKYALSQTLDELQSLKDSLYLETARGRLKAFPEMRKLVQAFALERMPMAVASGSSPAVIRQALEVTGLAPYFTHLYSSEQVDRPKPAPDLFLFAAAQLDVHPLAVLVFEDSMHGVAAAKAAGMSVAAVPFVMTESGQEQFRRADLLFPRGMLDFSAEAVLDWIDNRYCQCDDCSFFDLGRCND